MSEEIIIKMVTEKVLVDEMTDRERKIYDAGYNKGYDKGKEAKYNMYALAVVGLIAICVFMLKFFFSLI